MKFELNKIDEEKLLTLIDTREYNVYMSDLINELIKTSKRYFKGIDERDIFKVFLKRLDYDFDVETIVPTYFPNKIKRLDVSPYNENSYVNTIKSIKVKDKNYALTLETYKEKELFIYDDFDIDEDDYFKELPKLGYFNEEYKFLALKENGVIWMSIQPSEIDTMNEHIDEVKGNVLVYGLGLGYYQYMVSNKDNVNKVTIIERDSKIIKLFKENLLPSFPNKDKIEIIESDAYKFTSNNDLGVYDYVYIDLWHNPLDAIKFYMFFKKEELKYPNTTFLYWLEKGIVALIHRVFISLLIEQYEEGYDETYYQDVNEDSDILINKLYYYFKDHTFKSYEEIHNILKEDNIKELIKKL